MENDSFEIETKLNLAVLNDSDEEGTTFDNEAKSESEYSSGTTLQTVYDREREPFTHIIEGVLNQIEVQDMSQNNNELFHQTTEITFIKFSIQR